MVQTLTKFVSFEEFIQFYPETGSRYELHNGEIVEMNPPVGDHEFVIGFLVRKISGELDRFNLSYLIPKTTFIKAAKSESAYLPDILLLNPANLPNEPLWKKESTVTQAASVPLVIEIVSSNWQSDYTHKTNDYESMGITEYWIVVFNPKQPTISIYSLVDDEYIVNQFRCDDLIISPLFPELKLTLSQILQNI
ncbi:Uma2 family endonuclease [Dolichospermum circinale]|uniref:Uma2 family endonuclease n=1 Tax=Dolichospermum circinale TaxID=109265 RepID=UPI00232BBD66|nr:Uma2 family endonuclease [Dolichospermum circinale]MDB9456146.1 Uma2 family endonuclease [Dolichospermum circinale CS-541/06]MDB9463832.1 Uma2 family endonuclease [Dolichospermum circinale CS-541/04]MDB9545802.1 Uma2 family endonuclease [Dolichospermum circinale CS-1031]